MKIKMTEYFQESGLKASLVPSGIEVSLLEPGGVYEVNETLGAYLLDNRKAIKAGKEQPKNIKEFLTPEVHENVTNVQTEIVNEPEEIMHTKRVKRGKS